MLKRIGYCSRCGKCCNANSFPEGTTIATVREDGSCTYYYHGEPGGCLKEHTVSGKPLVCQLFPMGPDDIASIPECTYSFVRVPQTSFTSGITLGGNGVKAGLWSERRNR